MSKDTSWEHDKDFVDTDTGIVVRINILPLFYPQYSMEFGVKSPTYDENGFLLRHVKASSVSDFSLGDIFGNLVSEAQDYISQKVIERHAAIAAEQSEKAEKETNKRKRHQANFEARREANRATAKGGKKGGKEK